MYRVGQKNYNVSLIGQSGRHQLNRHGDKGRAYAAATLSSNTRYVLSSMASTVMVYSRVVVRNAEPELPPCAISIRGRRPCSKDQTANQSVSQFSGNPLCTSLM